jgi:glutamate N-acetyltransferase/amino-acid N-acetyltransferase
MEHLNTGLGAVPGFTYAAVRCGIRYPDRYDYCVIAADEPCNAAGMFTTNRVEAAPVKLCRSRINNPVRAILVNATNANACTGPQGYGTAETLTADIARRMKIAPESVLMASTGVIGHQLPVEKMLGIHGELLENLDQSHGDLIPRAIMTTDTVPKAAAVSFPAKSGECFLAGTAKGSGMIAPNMATLLSFIVTNATVPAADLDRIFRRSVRGTLNAITIDGDMSTNDTAIILSPADNGPSPDLDLFEEALLSVLKPLSEMLVSDGEGATKVVEINVKNAASQEDAEKIARAVAESLLVKTAFFGNDPNWGRIAAAVGYSGANISEELMSIEFSGIPILSRGEPVDTGLDRINQEIKKDRFRVTIDIGKGSSRAFMITSDISVDYVRINAEYST